MLNLLRKLLALALVIAATPVLAGAATGIIDNSIVVTGSGLVLVHSAGTPSGQPGCATSAGWFVVDPSTAPGKSQMLILGMAMTLGKSIVLAGAGTCNATVTNAENLTGVTYAP